MRKVKDARTDDPAACLAAAVAAYDRYVSGDWVADLAPPVKISGSIRLSECSAAGVTVRTTHDTWHPVRFSCVGGTTRPRVA